MLTFLVHFFLFFSANLIAQSAEKALDKGIKLVKNIPDHRKLSRKEKLYICLYIWGKYLNENEKIPEMNLLDDIINFMKEVALSIPLANLEEFELQMSMSFYPYLFRSDELEE